MAIATLSPEIQQKLDALLRVRQQCRIDLWFLMEHILGYKDIEREVHGPIVRNLPQFRGGADAIQSNGTILYTSAVDLWTLPGYRNYLFLDPRGHLKTSILTAALSIQWILNYPDIRILITSATADLSQSVLGEIKSHFQFNPMFRYHFPDFCPKAEKAGDFGNLEEFTVPNRTVKKLKEPTCSASSVGKTIAGFHYEVLACSDMVDKENVKTPGGLKEVIDHFRYMDNLLERHQQPEGSNLPNQGFKIVEGTRYDFGDLYGTIIDAQEKLPEAERDWLIHIRDAEQDATRQKTLWPSRFPWKELKKMEATQGPYIYSAQMRNKPAAGDSALCTLDDLMGIWVPRPVLGNLLPRLALHVTVDLASMEERASGDFIVLNLSGFDADGRMYFVDGHRGHFTELEVIDLFYDLFRRYPRILDFKVEKEARWKTLEPFLRREQVKRGQFLPPLIDIPRDTQTSKVSRIRGLQPWFKAKLIRIADDLPFRTDLLQEITRFPSKNVHDDILDTMADQMQNRDGGLSYDMIPADPMGELVPKLGENKFLGFDDITKQPRFLYDAPTANDEVYSRMTGI